METWGRFAYDFNLSETGQLKMRMSGKSVSLMLVVGAIASIGLYAFWRFGQIRLVAVGSAPIYELSGEPRWFSKEKDTVIGIVPDGERITSEWYYITKDVIVYRVRYKQLHGYMMIGDVVPVQYSRHTAKPLSTYNLEFVTS